MYIQEKPNAYGNLLRYLGQFYAKHNTFSTRKETLK